MSDLKEGQKPVNELVPGDKVIVFERDFNVIKTVERLTKTQVCIGKYSKYRRDSGRPVGADMWSFSHIEHATPEMIAEIGVRIARQKLVNNVARLIDASRVRYFSTKKLEAIKAAFEMTNDE